MKVVKSEYSTESDLLVLRLTENGYSIIEMEKLFEMTRSTIPEMTSMQPTWFLLEMRYLSIMHHGQTILDTKILTSGYS
ncbi:hypothetical protein D3C71_1929240 [compost metagenome]